MKTFFLILSIWGWSFAHLKNPVQPIETSTMPITSNYTYLALGDSYTIGESVAPDSNFPNQTATFLKKLFPGFHNPVIIAKTGWTTDELEAGINRARDNGSLLSSYDFVSLLIGVNNQYRGRPAAEYKNEFERLLLSAISFAGNKPGQVVVISIPDWGVTPYAEGQNRVKIETEIDEYNKINEQIARQYNVHYINITPGTREAATDSSLLAADGLHPSGKEYARWAVKVAEYFKSKIAD